MNTNNIPVGTGKAISCDTSYHGVDGSDFYVQTPDEMWQLMIARMKSQVRARDAAMATWERDYRDANVVGYPDETYWRAYYTEKARHRVDYPMPWGHIMFGRAA